ncbi:MAG: AAA family ATPase [Pseudomonadota bacterium]
MLYQFLEFTVDTERRELRRDGELVPIAHKAQSVLYYLIEHRDRMVEKTELLDRFWSREVSEAALQTTISVIRKALGADGKAVIKTYHGRGFRFVPEVAVVSDAASTTDGPELSAREQRTVSVLSARVTLTQQDDASVRAFLSTARALVDDEHGQPLRMLLDGFTAVFGLDHHSDDAVRSAATCAWKLIEASSASLSEWHAAQIGLGLSSGQIEWARDDGSDDWSPPEGVERDAARLAGLAENKQILIDSGIRFQLGDDARVREAPGQPHFELQSMPLPRAGIPLRWGESERPFVGRNAELALLNASLTDVEAGAAQTVVLSGPAGIGKTRVVREFLAELAPQRCNRVMVHCLPRLSDTPSAIIRQLCASLQTLGVEPDLKDHVASALFAQLMDENAKPDPILEVVSDHIKRKRTRDIVTGLVERASALGPLIIVFEDVHWIDSTSRSHLDALLQSTDQQRVMFVVTTRPADTPPIVEGELKLSPLSGSDSRKLLEQFSAGASLDAGDMETLIERAGGNPFFLEELALLVIDGDDPATAMPDTVQAVIEVRISTLSAGLRSLVYAVAVIGPPAAAALVAQLLGRSEESLHADLTQLVSLGFLRADSDSFAFRHMLLQNAAYEMIVPTDREQMHRRTAELLEASTDAVAAEVLAWHLEAAGESRRAQEYWKRASNAALSRSAGREAISFARRGLGLVAPDDPESAPAELGLQLALATAMMSQRGYAAETVGQAYRRAHQLCAGAGSPRARWRSLVGLWVHTWVAGRLQESLSYGRELLAFAEQADDPMLLTQAHGSLGAVLMHAGAFDSAKSHLEAGAATIPSDRPETIAAQNAAVNCLAYAGWVQGLHGQSEGLHGFLRASETQCDAIDNPFATAIHLALFSDAFMCAGDVDRTRDYAVRAAALSREHNFPFWLGTGYVMEGWALGRSGDCAAALEAIEAGLQIFQATGARVQMANWYGVQAETYLAAGRPEEGLVSLGAALECAERTGDIWYLPRIHSIASELYSLVANEELSKRHQTLAQDLGRDHRLAPVFVFLPGASPRA